MLGATLGLPGLGYCGLLLGYSLGYRRLPNCAGAQVLNRAFVTRNKAFAPRRHRTDLVKLSHEAFRIITTRHDEFLMR